MVNRVVSTKLTKEEHEKLIDECNKRGCSQAELLRASIKELIQPEVGELSVEDLRKALGIK